MKKTNIAGSGEFEIIKMLDQACSSRYHYGNPASQPATYTSEKTEPNFIPLLTSLENLLKRLQNQNTRIENQMPKILQNQEQQQKNATILEEKLCYLQNRLEKMEDSLAGTLTTLPLILEVSPFEDKENEAALMNLELIWEPSTDEVHCKINVPKKIEL